MLVLRRRAQEAIVFEGGLVLTLVDVIDHRAWLSFASPTIPVPVVVSALSTGPGTACIAVRSPASIARHGNVISMMLEEPAKAASEVASDAVLLVNRSLGDRLVFDGLSLEVASLDQGRAVLAARVAEVEGAVGVSVFSVSGVEVKIGIDAPSDVRVFREEIWRAMRSANEDAAAWSPSDLESLAASPRTSAGSDRD
ncbi:MAG: hypothetical protein JWO62_158 [Acidimicrobiaceae bacterium]|jgi:carbon storage regulator|nr:hypothetical protein [Acidimicrobiaceae bacterium]